jgi:phosphoglycerate dehydrogenase-like enzyme
MLASSVVLTSSAGNGGIPLAEHSMLLMLMLDRDVPRWLRAQSDRRWDRFTHGELAGRTLGIYGLGIYGLGNSGIDLARKAQAFHMRVLGVRRTGQPAPYVDEVCGLDRLLAESDFVVVTAPRTASTAGVFDRDAFARMKPTAYFICISRGGIADDDALLAALRSGQIAGAGLDAHGVEPLPPDSPFWSLPNVIVTPHNGATSDGTARRGREIVLGNLRRFVGGEALVNVVDKSAGY